VQNILDSTNGRQRPPGRPFRFWEPLLLAAELWLVILLSAGASLFGGLFLDARLHTRPVFATLGLALAFTSSVALGLLLVSRASGQPLLEPRTAQRLKQASAYALRLAGILIGIGALGVYGGWLLDAWLHTRPLLTAIGSVLGFAVSVLLGLRFTQATLWHEQRERQR